MKRSLKCFISIHIIFSVAFLKAQNSVLQDVYAESIIIDHQDSELVEGETLLFEELVNFVELDSVLQRMNVVLRGKKKNKELYKNKGNILSIDMSDKEIIFEREIDFNLKKYDFIDSSLIITYKSKSTYVRPQNLYRLWEVSDPFLFIFESKNVGLTYKKDGNRLDVLNLKGHDLTNGKTLWKRKIDGTFGWRELQTLNDSTLLINANGLHTINYKDGSGWDYNGKSGRKKANYWYGVENVIYNVCSNILKDSTSIYYASNNSLVKLDFGGNIIWEEDLPTEEVSKSVLFKKEQNIYLINFGLANSTLHGFQPIGVPSLSSYKLEDGSLIYKKKFAKKVELISPFIYDDKYLLIVNKKRLEKRELKTGDLLDTFESSNVGAVDGSFFLGEGMYLETDTGSLLDFGDKSSEYFYYCHFGKNVVSINKENLELKDIATIEEVYVLVDKIEGNKLVCNKNDCIILDKVGNPIYTMENISNAYFKDELLVIIQGNKIHLVLLSNLIKMSLENREIRG